MQEALDPTTIVIVGAGAAGLVAAAEAAQAANSVLVIEKREQPGIKILISGGGHCNVTTTLPPREAEAQFGPEGGRFLRHAIRAVPPERIRAWLREGGVETFEAEFDKVWPVSRRAKDVVRVLYERAQRAGARFCFGRSVTSLEASDDGWRLVVDGATTVDTKAVILACGGLSYPKTGTTGDGYHWLRELGLRVREPRPALAPLRVDDAWVHELAGLTLDDVEVQLREQSGRIVWRRHRPVLFTHKGLSGPGPMDASGRLEREPERYRFCVDLCPGLDEEQLKKELFVGNAGLEARIARHCGVPRRLAAVLVERHAKGIAPSEVTKDARRALLADLKGLAFDVRGSLGFGQAEVTTGGLELDQVDPRTMEVRQHEGLYVTGELLDVDGPIGGFSFLAAFATGALAGRAAAVRGWRRGQASFGTPSRAA